MKLRQDIRPNYSVKTRVVEALREFPATVRELEAATAGAVTSCSKGDEYGLA